MRARQRGVGYLGALLLLALAGLAVAGTCTVWSISLRREQERELLAVGNEFRAAIGNYYEHSPGMVKRYPATLDDLLDDGRFLATTRYLRRVYVDPVGGTAEWGVLRGLDGGIMGVYSLDTRAPLKQHGFRDRDAALEGVRRYIEWRFVYVPATI